MGFVIAGFRELSEFFGCIRKSRMFRDFSLARGVVKQQVLNGWGDRKGSGFICGFRVAGVAEWFGFHGVGGVRISRFSIMSRCSYGLLLAVGFLVAWLIFVVFGFGYVYGFFCCWGKASEVAGLPSLCRNWSVGKYTGKVLGEVLGCLTGPLFWFNGFE